jgi:hypothetical protein
MAFKPCGTGDLRYSSTTGKNCLFF